MQDFKGTRSNRAKQKDMPTEGKHVHGTSVEHVLEVYSDTEDEKAANTSRGEVKEVSETTGAIQRSSCRCTLVRVRR